MMASHQMASHQMASELWQTWQSETGFTFLLWHSLLPWVLSCLDTALGRSMLMPDIVIKIGLPMDCKTLLVI